MLEFVWTTTSAAETMNAPIHFDQQPNVAMIHVFVDVLFALWFFYFSL